ncbi:hypothetical protein LWI29_011706 [Acer saccharum]|uniref:Uncharacterized protein n=1 Tax=Acer saccharum TaxID=4024 RepID=A0AA39RHD0_ACESA|nr:hypothetical protein LWI29_011706 [Acer saccharum]
MVRSIKELIMNGVNFCELRKKEKKALKANWDAQMRENVETGSNMETELESCKLHKCCHPFAVSTFFEVECSQQSRH